MTKNRWEGSLSPFRTHIDPDKEQQLKWMKLGKSYSTREPRESLQNYWRMMGTALKPKHSLFKARLPPVQYSYPDSGYMWYTEWQLIRKITSNVKKILKLAKNINPGNKEGNLKKRAELINLVEDFQQQYDSLYSLYESLRGEVKKNIKSTDDDSSSSSTPDSESYYSPEEPSVRGGGDISKASYGDNQERESSDMDYTVMLKDKLTSRSEVKRSLSFDSSEVLKDLRIPEGPWREINQGRYAGTSNLEQEIENLQEQVGTLFMEKRNLEEQVESRSKEAAELEAKISRLEAQILETDSKFRDNELQCSSLKKLLEVNDEQYIVSRVSDLVTKTDSLQAEVNNLQLQKAKLEELLSGETDQNSYAEGLLERIDFLEKDLAAVNSKEIDLELVQKNRSEDMSVQIEMLNNQGQEVQLKELEMEIYSLSSDKRELEQQVKKINQDAFQLNIEKVELTKIVYGLQTALSERDKQHLREQEEFREHIESMTEKGEVLETMVEALNVEVESLQKDKRQLQMELEEKEKQGPSMKSQLEKRNMDLTDKIADQQKTLHELGGEINRLKDEGRPAQGKFLDSKSNLQLLERKVDDIAEEFRQQFEAKYTILSRRIRVAEQLHVENKEWFMKSKDRYEQENRELKEKVDKFKAGMKSVKDMSLKANDVLTFHETVSLKFEECMAHFLNRISKSSCELKFVKDWAMRKHRALSHVKDELECLVKQLDVKEAEILVFRERVWKSENKVRELEKMVKEKDDGMLGLQEEKREAIRQLCVWIDYHRSRSDYYMKMLSEMNPGRKRP